MFSSGQLTGHKWAHERGGFGFHDRHWRLGRCKSLKRQRLLVFLTFLVTWVCSNSIRLQSYIIKSALNCKVMYGTNNRGLKKTKTRHTSALNLCCGMMGSFHRVFTVMSEGGESMGVSMCSSYRILCRIATAGDKAPQKPDGMPDSMAE